MTELVVDNGSLSLKIEFNITADMIIFAVTESLFWKVDPKETKEDLLKITESFISEYGYEALTEQNSDTIDDCERFVKDKMKRARDIVKDIMPELFTNS